MYENNENPEILNNLLKLEPIIYLIIQSLDCNNNTIISNSLKILQYVIKWPLTTLKKNYKKTVNSILNVRLKEKYSIYMHNSIANQYINNLKLNHIVI